MPAGRLRLRPADRCVCAGEGGCGPVSPRLKSRAWWEIEALWLEEADRLDQTLDADPSRAIPGIVGVDPSG